MYTVVHLKPVPNVWIEWHHSVVCIDTLIISYKVRLQYVCSLYVLLLSLSDNRNQLIRAQGFLMILIKAMQIKSVV